VCGADRIPKHQQRERHVIAPGSHGELGGGQARKPDAMWVSERTLERWRWLGQPPRFLKIGGRVVYRLEDIEAFEAKQLRQRTPRRCKSRGSAIAPEDSQNA
jgi:hypothetical protein